MPPRVPLHPCKKSLSLPISGGGGSRSDYQTSYEEGFLAVQKIAKDKPGIQDMYIFTQLGSWPVQSISCNELSKCFSSKLLPEATVVIQILPLLNIFFLYFILV